MGDSIRVLHVDDEPDFAALTADFLDAEDDRFVVDAVTEVGDGMKKLKESSIDCIVSDFDMPGKNGIEFLEHVRSNHPDLPFILFTGKGSEEVASEAISAGVTDYLQKEAGTEQYTILANRILNYVERTRAEQERRTMQRRMELALERTQSLIFEIDLDSGSITREGDFERLFEQPGNRSRSIDAFLDTVVHSEDRETVRRFYQEFMDGDREFGEIEYRTLPVDGSVRWINVIVSIDEETEDDDRIAVGIARDITDRKAREAERRRKERRYDAIFEDPNILVGLTDTDGTVLDINQTAMEYIDASIQEVTGESFWETPWFGHDEDVRADVKAWIDQAASGEYVEFEVELVRPNGRPYWIEGVFRPVTNEDGEVVSLVISDREITERKERERDLQQERDRFRTVFEEAFDAMVIGDDEGKYVDVNQSATELFGLPEGELLGRSIAEFVPGDFDSESAWHEFRGLEGERGTFPLVRADGTKRLVEYAATRDVVPGQHLSVLRDVTQREERKQELQRVKDHMEYALDSTDSIVWTWDVERDEATFHPSEEALYGTTVENWEDFIDVVHPEDRQTVEESIERSLQNEGPTYEEFRIAKDGEVRWIEARGQAYQDDPEESPRVIGIAKDVTEEKQRALERQWMLQALDQSSEAVFVSDPERGEIEFVNDTAARQLGYDRGELLDMTIPDIQPLLPTIEAWKEHIDRLRSEGHRLFEGRHVRRDGTEFPVEVNTGIVQIDRREYVLGIARDITHRKERERELQQQIDRLNEFASIVSHDLRNPLNVAVGQLKHLTAEVDHERLDVVERSLERMETIIDDLLTLAREGGPSVEFETVSISDLARSSWETVDTVDAGLHIESDRQVRADPGRLQRLLENLFGNAVEHVGDDVAVTVGLTEDGFFVEDDGAGVPVGDRERIFETGYSTREGGTGFGLSIVEKIALAHGWTIRVTDGRDGGARFTFEDVEIVTA